LAYLAREAIDFGTTVTVVGGLWSAVAPAAIICYNDRAKAKDDVDIRRLEELEAEKQAWQAEREAAQRKLNAEQAASKKAKTDLATAKKEIDAMRQNGQVSVEDIVRQALEARAGS